jgi:hypothetical protein
MLRGEVVLFFRPRELRENVTVKVLVNSQEIYSQDFLTLCPQEVERLAVTFGIALTPESKVELRMQNADTKMKNEARSKESVEDQIEVPGEGSDTESSAELITINDESENESVS